VHFGIVMTLNLAIGLFTPLFGINIFVAHAVLGMKVADIYRGVATFYLVFLAVLVLITFMPGNHRSRRQPVPVPRRECGGQGMPRALRMTRAGALRQYTALR
jgi:hypothetical protein